MNSAESYEDFAMGEMSQTEWSETLAELKVKGCEKAMPVERA
jgi:hypothetical protein